MSRITPSFEEFAELSRDATLVPVALEFLFDTETAVSAYHKVARAPFGFLLESAVGGETWARYTFLGTEPRSAWKLQGGHVHRWTPEDGWQDQGPSADPLGEFDRMMQSFVPAQVQAGTTYLYVQPPPVALLYQAVYGWLPFRSAHLLHTVLSILAAWLKYLRGERISLWTPSRR